MKIRNGFVSNSSSSSFIIPIENIPSSVEDLQQMMFGDVSDVEYMFNWDREKKMLDAKVMSEIVYKDMVRSNQKSIDDILRDTEDDWGGDEIVDELKDMIKKYPDKKIIILSYSDNDGNYFTQLEHSGIIESTFKGSVKISQH
jgi:hypothetical protein